MSRLLAALRRIEARSDMACATVATDAGIEQRVEDDPVAASSLPPQESYAWPGDIVYDPQGEYPGHWDPQSADWPAVTEEPEAGYSNSSPWPELGFAGLSAAPIADEQDAEDLDLKGEDGLEEAVVCAPVVEEFPSFAEPLNHDQAIIGTEPESPAEQVWIATTTPDEIVTEVAALAAEPILPVTDDLSSSVSGNQPSTPAEEDLPRATDSLKAGVGKLMASITRMDDSYSAQVATNEQAPFSRQTSEETSDEPVVSVRLPGFGRPNRRGRIAGETTATEGFRRPALVPFLPPQQRPYREACESILSALPQGNSVALVLAWTDEDLDHCVLSARLAEVMADRLDDPVLLIDMGPKRRLSTLLQAPAIGSLTEAMVGFVSWRDQIVQTSTAGLCLLPSGPNDFEADPVAVARLIEACKEDFGIVLVVGGSLSVIPENVLTACDAAVLLVEAGHTSAAKAAGAIERLRRSGTDVAGCLLTGAAEGK